VYYQVRLELDVPRQLDGTASVLSIESTDAVEAPVVVNRSGTTPKLSNINSVAIPQRQGFMALSRTESIETKGGLSAQEFKCRALGIYLSAAANRDHRGRTITTCTSYLVRLSRLIATFSAG
jgi:hypothetical protein